MPPEWSYAPLSFMISPDNVLPYGNVCFANGKERILGGAAQLACCGLDDPGRLGQVSLGHQFAGRFRNATPLCSAWRWRFEMRCNGDQS